MNMPFFSEAPVKKKLMFISLFVVIIALLLSSTLIVISEMYAQRKIYLGDLSIQAQIIGKNSMAALLFNDYNAAEEGLSSLKINPNVIYAALLDSSGRLFVSYRKTGAPLGTPYPVNLKEGYIFGIDYLALSRPILFENETIGSIHIYASLKGLYYYLFRVVLTVIVVIIISLFVVYLFLLRLQQFIVKPLASLASLMQDISRDKNYSLRAKIQHKDEIGILAREFNEMLTQIQRRDNELEQHGKYLEDQVEKRTEAVLHMNVQLVDELNERRQIEKTLKELEQKYRNLFDNLNDAAFLVDLLTDEIVETNQKGEVLLGRAREEIVGLKHWIMYSSRWVVDHKDVFRWYLGQLGEGIPSNIEAEVMHSCGKVIPVEISASIISVGNRNMVLGLFRDITERQEADKKIKTSLEEKELLLKEIHHRVKNNLQVVSSLLYLQSENVMDMQALEIFKESETRIKSMALIHEKLYQSEDLSHIDFDDYIKNLTAHLFSTYNVNSNFIILALDVKRVFLPIDMAIPCGLIVNELVSNSLKYAFIGEKKGEIRINFHEQQDMNFEDEMITKTFILVVGDNGTGMPVHIDFKKTKSLGLRLVNALTNQLSGDIELNNTGGAEFRITFSRRKPKTNDTGNHRKEGREGID